MKFPRLPVDDELEIRSLFARYGHFADAGDPLYYGRQYAGYPFATIGNPFYGSEEWQRGDIVYRDMAYSGILLKYDLVKDEVLALRQQPGNDIFIGSRSLIIQLLKLGLIDELQLCIYPVVAEQGQRLFEDLDERSVFRLIKTKSFKGGAIILYYQAKRND